MSGHSVFFFCIYTIANVKECFKITLQNCFSFSYFTWENHVKQYNLKIKRLNINFDLSILQSKGFSDFSKTLNTVA